jgi:hypothetical protein
MSYATSILASLLHFPLKHHIMLLWAHICSYTLDHMEQKLEESTEETQVKAIINLALDQGKPRCITPNP